MFRNLIILAALAALLWAAPAVAGDWTNCAGGAGSTELETGWLACWEFTDASESPAFTFKTTTGMICLNPNTASEGPATAEIQIRHCPSGTKPSSNPEYACTQILDSPLTGLAGADGTQRTCQRVGRGTYYIEPTASAGGQAAVASARGE